MVLSVIQVGNSRGVRFPKIILDKLSVKDKLNMEVTDNEIILTPIKEPPERDGRKHLALCIKIRMTHWKLFPIHKRLN